MNASWYHRGVRLTRIPLDRDPRYPRSLLGWAAGDVRVADRFLELYRNRTIAGGLIGFAAVAVLVGIDVVTKARLHGAIDVMLDDAVVLAYGVSAGVLAWWVWHRRRHTAARPILPLCLATLLVVATLAAAVYTITTDTVIPMPEIYFAIGMLAAAGLLPLPPGRHLAIALPATLAAIAVTHAAGSPYPPVATTGLLATIFVIGTGMANLNFRRLRLTFGNELRAEDAVRDRDEFLRILAHDLRNPIGALPEFATLVRRKASEGSGADISTELDILASTARGINALLENILLWGKARSGAITPRPGAVDLVAMTTSMVERVAAAAHLKGVDLESEVPDALCVVADAELLQVIVRNLVDNAVKFTEPGGTVRLSCRGEEHRAVIRVEDDGIGMPSGAEVVQRPGTRGERGSGIGLDLVRSLADQLGAELTFDSAPGAGTRVEVSIPLGFDPEALRPPPSGGAAGSRSSGTMSPALR